ncbi:helix-turn-helix transcriptional regulator [Curtobacterium sp. VKM Ac-1376]|uniref:helix-turn-helix transcriptional regulator n=1 Tax=Curtobacterium sp. VKM Ac-1376 TaxID=123312 RepID=UPI00188C43B4|nr:helix-turn-helix transcriptional regulator [Curtobacterium sp. VKM Ac-1376]MBF4613439.1 helix-turn-helix domain-containing protein [Curtobacterium sp. VKM Ac-1376]
MVTRSALLGDYLRARRDRTRPEDIGLHPEPNRRVPGLRREEVAAAAGISAEYYLRLERGRDHQPSEQVVVALARALALDRSGLEYLRRLARPAPPAPDPRTRTPDDHELQRLLARHDGPAFVADEVIGVVASNPLAAALSESMRPGANRLVQMFTTMDRSIYPEWHRRAREMVAVFRMRSDLSDPRVHAIVGQLSVRDPDFAAFWASHDTRVFTTGPAYEVIPPFGLLEFECEDLGIPGRDGLTLTTLYAAPASRAAPVIAFVRERLAHQAHAERPTRTDQ